jgi:hypothetical protein
LSAAHTGVVELDCVKDLHRHAERSFADPIEE